eukprot:CAMPEP_0114625324 /NCGR_PEP_ID=MMETSP0168-20121206/11213_1 /TAXON_ID=95228 ORGANISM="Vannella sp., Strain DIVA3 517/6/12" /NCGR_SAMPLE_ID=MMETSP0168 /ASSEMBLY_ACC=CAM_ASM_000044 /LENGTH=175 /DNA_ID=CAMNT_0001836605 /DNA_START=82 /DNA_END=605 /DNA_ORIENTATION=-
MNTSVQESPCGAARGTGAGYSNVEKGAELAAELLDAVVLVDGHRILVQVAHLRKKDQVVLLANAVAGEEELVAADVQRGARLLAYGASKGVHRELEAVTDLYKLTKLLLVLLRVREHHLGLVAAGHDNKAVGAREEALDLGELVEHLLLPAVAVALLSPRAEAAGHCAAAFSAAS